MTDLQKQQITQMREQGRTYSEISESLSIAVGTIKAFCSRKAPKASAVPVPVVQATITEGRCKRCGQPLINTPGHRQKTFCSSSCQRKYWQEHKELLRHDSFVTITCPACGKQFSDYAGHRRKYCSHSCYITHRYGGASYEPKRNNLSGDDETVSKYAE